MRHSRFVVFFAVLAALAVPVRAAADVVKVVVDDTIHPIVAEHIQRAVQEAQRTHADALLIELRTPGGLVTSTREIVHTILTSPVPVIVYVTPPGSNAASAGFYILESADVAAMAPGTNTGAAHPVEMNSTPDSVLKEKMENDAAAFLRSYAAKRGRNEEIAETAVRQSKSFTADEALSKHLIDTIAANEADLFRQLEGKTITRFDGSRATLHLSGKSVRLFEMTVRQRVLSVLMDPNILFLLFAIGMMAIYAEFSHPGAVVPGVVGFIAVLLALFALQLLPVRYAALIMIVVAFVLFALEAKFQTHGIIGIGGIVVMIMGALLLVDGPIPEMRVRVVTALAVSIPLGAITIFLMSLAIRARRNKVVTGEQGLIGQIAVTRTPLNPAGKVFVNGELWDAVASTQIPAGAPVIVSQITDLVLHVSPAPATAPAVHSGA